MADTYTSSNRLALQATGDNPTTWGQRLNTRVFDMVDEALDGVNELDITVTTAYTLTTASGTTDQARKRTLHITGVATANATVTVPALSKFYVVKCSYTGAYTVTIKTASDAGVSFTAGDGGLVYVTSSGVFEVLRKSDMLLAANNLSDLLDPEAARTALGMGNPTINTFTNDGATLSRTLTQNPGSLNAVVVVFDGVVQTPTVDYTLSGTTLTYTTQPASGTKELIFIGNQSLPAGEPSDASVTLAKLSSSVYATEAEALAGSNSTKLMTPLRTSQFVAQEIAGVFIDLHASAALSTLTAKDFTVPSGVKRVNVHFIGVSLSGTDSILIQIGSGGTPLTSGYGSTSGLINNAGGTYVSGSSAGFIIRVADAPSYVSGTMTLQLVDEATDTWVAIHNLIFIPNNYPLFGAGGITVSNEVDIIRITRSGSNTFDAGSVSVSFEY